MRIPYTLPRESSYFIAHLTALAEEIRRAVVEKMRTETAEHLATQADFRGGDVLYHLDIPAESAFLAYCRRWGEELPLQVIAEGLEGEVTFPDGTPLDQVAFTLILDPVDGTRGLMYSKRSAWTLLGVAPPPRLDWKPRLQDIAVAVQSELPTPRAALVDTVWAVRGGGVSGVTRNLYTGEQQAFVPRPSQAMTLANGFASFVNYFPGFKRLIATIEEAVYAAINSDPDGTTPRIFDDQYISSGGQLYEIALGHDRFVADLRPLFRGETPSLCSHPYDVCASLIASEAGVIIRGLHDEPLDAPLDTHTPVGFVAYANRHLYHAISPVLQTILRDQGWQP